MSNHTAEGFSLFGSWDGAPCENVTVRDCYFGASPNLPAYPTGVGNHRQFAGTWNKNINIYNNLFDGMPWGGIRPYKFSDLKIHHNHFNNCAYGVRFSNYDGLGVTGGNPESAKNIEISDNTFVGTLVRDIYIAAWEKGGFVARCANTLITFPKD
ncbi:right-handed parallel beta-helix repeat-containing protein [Peribacillus butanolivorans]|uniref:right-handed parallel beta-helix repeat-containing protein n=1 Tax=Peribacillus butanolivorans TaxID=421767 RepID=UPI003674DA9D